MTRRPLRESEPVHEHESEHGSLARRRRLSGSRRTAPPCILALSVALACGPSDPSEVVGNEPDPEPLPAVTLQEGATYGTETFPPGNAAQGGQGDVIAGIGCVDEIDLHYHAHLSLFVEGERIAIPPAVGVVDPILVDGFVEGGSCLYWMHLHDGTGLVHLEPPVAGDYTLGQLFDVWGRGLTRDQVAGFPGVVSVFVDGVRYQGDIRDLTLTSGLHVSLQVGRPLSSPPIYVFQP